MHFPKIGNKAGMTLTTSFLLLIEATKQGNKSRKWNKMNPSGKKEIKLCLFANNMIFYLKNSVEPIKMVLDLEESLQVYKIQEQIIKINCISIIWQWKIKNWNLKIPFTYSTKIWNI